MNSLRLVAAATFLLAVAILPNSATAQVNVSGSWSNIDALGTGMGTGADNVYCQGLYNNDQEIRYGATYYDNGYWSSMCYYSDKPGGQSGLGFYGNSNINFQCQDPNAQKVLYNIGTFKHFNEPIYIKKALDDVYSQILSGGNLNVDLSGSVNASYDFWVDFEETPNDPSSYPIGVWNTSTCPFGESGGECNDRVSIDNVVDPGNEVTINGLDCQIVIEGFGDCNTAVSSDPVEFITSEGGTNTACLWASMSSASNVAGIGDFVWEDSNANGIQDSGESGLDGINIELHSSSDGVNYSFLASTTSANGGAYGFNNLFTNAWYKVYVNKSGLGAYGFTSKSKGVDSSKDSDIDYSTGFTEAISLAPLAPGQDKLDIDFGLVPFSAFAGLAGEAWIDRSGDGTLESAAELAAPLVGATANLYRDDNGDGTPDGPVEQSIQTAGDGSYAFTGLNPAFNYVVEMTNIPSIYPGFAAQNSGSDDTIDNDFNPATGTTGSINLAPSQSITEVDAGVNPDGILIIIYDDPDAPSQYNAGGAPSHAVNDYLYIGNGIGGQESRKNNFDRIELAATTLDDGIEGPDEVPDDPVMGFDLDVTVESNAWAALTCWVDFDQSGSFDDDEKTEVNVNGTGVISVPMITTLDVVAGATFGRCRLAYDGAQVADSGGPAGSGEVEDFGIVVGPALPVELISFDAKSENESVVLRWSTATETNNLGFHIERAINDQDFRPVTFVEGHGTTTMEQSYQISFDNMDPGVHAYRLKQVDFDGSYEYSRVVELSVDLPSSVQLSNAYPNPFNPSSTIRFSVQERTMVSAGVYDLTGRLRISLFSGVQEARSTRELRIDASSLTSGTYLVRLEADGEIIQRSITVMK